MKINLRLIYFYLFLSLFLVQTETSAQSNFVLTHPKAEQVLKGNYNPKDFYNTRTASTKNEVVSALFSQLQADSLGSYLQQLENFQNRNTGSDTVSFLNGIGAARRWGHSKFEGFNKFNNNSLLLGYFQFDQAICTKNQHRNVMAILPGTDSSLKDFVLIEAHLDSRCETVCDTLCLAQGMEDNGSGVALVLELARVMSKNLYPRTLVFMLTIGEEQGLDGANAFAVYCKNNGLNLRAVLNNDVIGGIICGKTASAPGCPGENEVDSINVRIFSAGANYSAPKGFARFCKLEFEEEMLPLMAVKTKVNIMNAEDRVGRGGDHIPFRQQGYTAIRFTSANEHGDASNATGYTDRQHSSRDVLGKDLNQDGKYDSLYVNTNYLLRNCYLNGISAATAAIGPAIPEFDLVNDGNGLSVLIKNPVAPNNYRIGFRSRSHDFDTIFTLIGATDLKTYHVKKDSFYFVSVARQNEEGVESLFAIEKYVKVLGVPATGINNNSYKEKTVQLLPVNPNPIDETLSLSIYTSLPQMKQVAKLLITDMQGKIVHETELVLDKEISEVLFVHGFQAKGIYHCSLLINNQLVDTQKLLFK
jgi:hypothetical protein